MLQSNSLSVLNTKCYVWKNPIQHVTEYHSPYIQAQWWLHHVMGMLLIVKDWGVFQDKKINGAKLRQNHRRKLGSVCFPPDTGICIRLSA
jgi:hypothetical protein